MIADVTDPDAIQTILAHLRQRAPPDAVHRQRPGQGPQNDLFAAIRLPACLMKEWNRVNSSG